ncbi:hypothetical protein VTO42DRAFT_2663 [Malbranchea cinnamomea]
MMEADGPVPWSFSSPADIIHGNRQGSGRAMSRLFKERSVESTFSRACAPLRLLFSRNLPCPFCPFYYLEHESRLPFTRPLRNLLLPAGLH